MMASYMQVICRRLIAFCLAGMFVVGSVPADAAQQATQTDAEEPQSGHRENENNGAQTDKIALPDAPPAPQAESAHSPAPAKPQKGTQAQQPVGTAAAGIENTAGVAASKPAGVAIAPPKQRRMRSLVIKVGAIAGAGVALGTVMALSKASPSRPPGAH